MLADKFKSIYMDNIINSYLKANKFLNLILVLLFINLVSCNNSQEIFEKFNFNSETKKVNFEKYLNKNNGKSRKEDKANQFFNDYNLSNAILYFEKLINSNKKISVESYENLANSYYFKGEYELAYKYYKIFDSLSVGSKSSLFKLNYENSKKSVFSREHLKNIDSTFNILDLSLNSEFNEFSTFYKPGKLFIISDQPEPSKNRIIDNWTNRQFNKLFELDLNTGQKTKVLDLPKNTVQVGSYFETTDGNKMYLTVNEYSRQKGKSQKFYTLKIYSFEKINGQWVNPKSFKLNSEEYSCGFPSIDSKGEFLYFVSNMPGGYGESDIYRVKITGNEFGLVENLGEKVNSIGRESFPYLDSNGDLYFSSDGHNGYGGFDIYKININQKDSLVNLGPPINSNLDDFGYIKTKKNEGYFNSNRLKNKNDDIFYFVRADLEPYKIKLKEIELMERKNDSIKLAYKPQPIFSDLEKQKIALEEKKVLSREEKDNIKLDLEKLTIYFDFNSSILSRNSKLKLEKVYKLMDKYPSIKILVSGHTDLIGTEVYNDKLSNKRAEVTSKYIYYFGGIPKSRMIINYFGERKPINNCINCSPRKSLENRRVEFDLIE